MSMAETGKKIVIYEREGYKKLGDLFGLFFEDLNHAADGGLYGEMLQNRSFEFCSVDRADYEPLTAWGKSENLEWEIGTRAPLHEENPHYLHVVSQAGGWVRNVGYDTGLCVEKGKKYRFSCYMRCPGKEQNKSGIRLEVSLQGVLEVNCPGQERKCTAVSEWLDCTEENAIASAENGWNRFEKIFTAMESISEGFLQILFPEAAVCDLDMISLFPVDTFRGRENGLRRDIAEALAEMKPKFLRFPGGCLVHDGSLDTNARNSMYRWKKTVGPVEARPSRRNNWGYNQSLGLGYYEYFCFCEDIGASPLPVLPGGFNPHKGEGCPMDQIQEWVQDALDLIEFANGDENTPWGSLRARMGHKEPFGLEYLAIGNEEVGDGFFERYPFFHQAIREKAPQIKIINSAGPFSSGESYVTGWTSARKYGSDLIDEHYYSSPEWFLANMHHYDDYDPDGPKVFLGEYASWGNTFYNALTEAAYMTHLEKARAVALACYAPMLCHKAYVNWKPDMLWFDNRRIMKTANYYVQKMFMVNQGTEELRYTAEQLDEVIPLSDADRIMGEITIQGNDVEGRIWDVAVTDLETGERKSRDGFAVTTENLETTVAFMDSRHYTLEFSFRRSAGRKGLKISVGKKNADNYLQWEFGGWDNWDCNVVSVVNGRNSAISQRLFHVEDKDYRLKMEVEGRRLRTWVNGELYNDTVDRLPELEELYLAASRDAQEGTVILKAVNLTGEEKCVELRVEGAPKRRAYAESLSGYALSAENTFEEPELIHPCLQELQVEDNRLVYTFPAHSFTVIRMEEKPGC